MKDTVLTAHVSSLPPLSLKLCNSSDYFFIISIISKPYTLITSKQDIDSGDCTMSKSEFWSIFESGDAVALKAFCEKNPKSQHLKTPKNGDGFPPIFTACLDSSKASLIPVLVESGKVNANELLRSGFIETLETPIIFACTYGNAAAVKELLELGADKTIRDWRGFSAIDALIVTKMKCKRYGGSYARVTTATCDEIFALLGGEKQCAVCFAVCSLACGQCKIAHYCSAAHQKLHWKQSHKMECSRLSKPKTNDQKTLYQNA